MMEMARARQDHGFSLVELLVVTALMGVVAAALFALHQTTQRTAYTSEEVVEVQQNLRIGMEQIATDLRMAGFMLPPLDPAFQQANPNDLTILTASAFRRAARIEANQSTTGAATMEFNIALPEMVDLFSPGDRVIILRPPNQTQPITGLFTVAATNRGELNNPANPPQLSLEDFTGLADINFLRGDMIMRTNTVAPDVITYCLGPAADCGPGAACSPGQTCLMRVVNGVAAVVANNIEPAGLQLQYLPAGAIGNDIKAVRVTISGQTVSTVAFSGNVPKVRTLSSVVTLRNR
jgi:prepilin-type N-terminal cleavage/methylation domain-containing protein